MSKKFLITEESTTSCKIKDGKAIQIAEFTQTGNHIWIVPEGVTKIDVLVVAGGGGSGKGTTNTSQNGGGGGSGGLIFVEGYDITGESSISLSVGQGGSGSTDVNNIGTSGEDSIFHNLIAKGGGGGGSSSNRNGQDGGSGGGGGVYSSLTPRNGGESNQSTINDGYENTGFGNYGSDGYHISQPGFVLSSSGGGGGAGGPGGAEDDFHYRQGIGKDILGVNYARGGGGQVSAFLFTPETTRPSRGDGGNAPLRNSSSDGGSGTSGIIVIWEKASTKGLIIK